MLTLWALATMLSVQAGALLDVTLPTLAKLPVGDTSLVPNLPVLDIPAPNLPVPDIPVPNIPVPNIPVPNIPVPDIPVPNIPVPDIPAPNIPVPNIPVPNIPVPNIPVPNIPVPDISRLNTHLPRELLQLPFRPPIPKHHPPRKQVAENAGGQCPVVAKYHLSESRLSEYVNATLPGHIEKMLFCEKFNLGGLVGTVLSTVTDSSGLLSVLNVASSLDILGGGGLGGILGQGSSDSSPNQPPGSKATKPLNGQEAQGSQLTSGVEKKIDQLKDTAEGALSGVAGLGLSGAAGGALSGVAGLGLSGAAGGALSGVPGLGLSGAAGGALSGVPGLGLSGSAGGSLSAAPGAGLSGSAGGSLSAAPGVGLSGSAGGSLSAAPGVGLNGAAGGSLSAAPAALLSGATGGLLNGVAGGLLTGAAGRVLNRAAGGVLNGAPGALLNRAAGGVLNGAAGGVLNGVAGGVLNGVAGGALNGAAGGVLNGVVPPGVNDALKGLLSNGLVEDLLDTLAVQKVTVENLKLTTKDDSILAHASITVSLGGKGLIGPVISILGFQVEGEIALEIGIATNDTQCVNLQVQSKDISANKVSLLISQMFQSLPIPLPLDSLIPTLLTAEMNAASEESKSCVIDFSDFNQCKNSTGLFKYRLKDSKISTDGLSITYCADAVFKGKSSPVPGSRLPPDPKNANVSLTLAHTLVREIVAHCAKPKYERAGLVVSITKVAYLYISGRTIQASYSFIVEKDGEIVAKGETALVISCETKISGGKMNARLTLSSLKHNTIPPAPMVRVKNAITETLKKFWSCLTETIKQMNVPTGVSSNPLIDAKVNSISKDLQAAN